MKVVRIKIFSLLSLILRSVLISKALASLNYLRESGALLFTPLSWLLRLEDLIQLDLGLNLIERAPEPSLETSGNRCTHTSDLLLDLALNLCID